MTTLHPCPSPPTQWELQTDAACLHGFMSYWACWGSHRAGSRPRPTRATLLPADLLGASRMFLPLWALNTGWGWDGDSEAALQPAVRSRPHGRTWKNINCRAVSVSCLGRGCGSAMLQEPRTESSWQVCPRTGVGKGRCGWWPQKTVLELERGRAAQAAAAGGVQGVAQPRDVTGGRCCRSRRGRTVSPLEKGVQVRLRLPGPYLACRHVFKPGGEEVASVGDL